MKSKVRAANKKMKTGKLNGPDIEALGDYEINSKKKKLHRSVRDYRRD